MPRLHLVELEDLPWFPAPVRDAGTGYLQFMIHAGDAYAPAIPLLAQAVRRSGATRLVDLCSGGGGPWRRLKGELAAAGLDLPILLTDKFPNPGAADAIHGNRAMDGVTFHPTPVDARHVPATIGGFRTMFTAFHHFRMLLAPFIVLLLMPWVRPFRLSNLLVTYLIPLVPLMILRDGIVSALRTYDVRELQSLVDAVKGGERFHWDLGELPAKGPIPITYLIGTPRT